MNGLLSYLRQRVFILKRKWDRKTLRKPGFTVIANDCWGGELYHYFNLPYNTPFVGLYLMAPCFIRFLKNPDYYLSLELSFRQTSTYAEVEQTRAKHPIKFPVGVLDDIEIQFMHYKTEEEARQKWNRRKQRMNKNRIFVKFDGSKDGANDALIDEFDRLPYAKICLVNKPYPLASSAVFVPDWEQDGAKMFAKTMRVFNVKKWLNT